MVIWLVSIFFCSNVLPFAVIINFVRRYILIIFQCTPFAWPQLMIPYWLLWLIFDNGHTGKTHYGKIECQLNNYIKRICTFLIGWPLVLASDYDLSLTDCSEIGKCFLYNVAEYVQVHHIGWKTDL